MQEDLMHSDRLLNLLDKAYDAPFRPDSFHDLMHAAQDFYFAGPGQGTSDLLGQTDLENNPVIASHLSRIERLLNEREMENRSRAPHISRPGLAALLIDCETGMVEGNSLSEVFFGQRFPLPLKDLNLDAASRALLERRSRITASSADPEGDICLIKRRDDPVAHLAKCGKWVSSDFGTGTRARGLAVSVAHFEWTAEALEFCQSMFNLSASETEVLAALLNGKSQPEIANLRGRSVETIKAQSKAILRKSGCRRIADLLVLATTYGLLADTGTGETSRSRNVTPGIAHPDRIHLCPDGRRISYGVFGDPEGRPVLFIHGLVQGPFFPTDMVDRFMEEGICIIAPSRPGFGQTDAPARWSDFDRVVIADMLDLLPQLTDRPVTVVAHQGGVSHACRIAGALGGKARNMVMISAGIPIDEQRHLAHMGLQTRVAALGVKYTPRILETMIHIGIVSWLRKGIKPYLEHLYSNSPTDLAHMEDPRIRGVSEAGILHMIEQGAKAIIHDGRAAMADWTGDFTALTIPVSWIHGTDDPVMRHDFVEEFVAAHGGKPVEIVPHGGHTLHLSHSALIHRAIEEAVLS